MVPASKTLQSRIQHRKTAEGGDEVQERNMGRDFQSVSVYGRERKYAFSINIALVLQLKPKRLLWLIGILAN